ncbi:MAG: DNA/RNA non-specific endonuclease [Pseudomonadota bacterium]
MVTRFLTGVLLLVFAQPVWSLSQTPSQEFEPSGLCSEHVEYLAFSICYDREHRQASWVKHKITLEMIDGKVRRTNDYREDPNLYDPVTGRDYRGSGFDRGHLAPAADFKLNRQMMSESFYMTNMSPQNPGFNRGIWVSIEKSIRYHVRQWGTAHVITAPVLDAGLDQIKSGVSIPDWYYKIAYYPNQEVMIAFLIENRRFKGAKIEQFMVTVDEIEQLTGFDFYKDLPDVLEDSLESQVSQLAWATAE